MHLRTILCAALFSAVFTVTSFASASTAQVIGFGEEGSQAAIELTGSKIITDNFSFKVPDDLQGSCILVAEDENYHIYQKDAYEADGTGLLFTIACYEDLPLERWKDLCVLGFCDSRTYILEPHYESIPEDEVPLSRAGLDDASRFVKRSFVSYIK